MIHMGLIGFGNRGRIYSLFASELKDKVSLDVCVDFNLENIKNDASKFAYKKYYKNTEDFFNANEKLDLLVISSMDQYHFDNCKKAIEHGYNVLLEKPIAKTLKEVLYLQKLAKKYNVKVIVCYVLRYTKFYRAIKDICDSNKIGNIININTTENVAYWHYAHSFTRGNWRNSKETTPMILAKCSHDLDILYWLINKFPTDISSFGSLDYLTIKNKPDNASTHCTDCKLKDSCCFNAYDFYLKNKDWLIPWVGSNPSDKIIIDFLDNGKFSKCVYQCDNDVVDHQIVNIKFENNVTASHTMNAYSKDCYRDIKVFGTNGFIEGDFRSQIIKVSYFLNNITEEIDINKLTTDFYGHGGGDRALFNELIEYLETGKKSVSLNTLDDSVISHYMGFAAEKSRIKNGKVIKIKLK